MADIKDTKNITVKVEDWPGGAGPATNVKKYYQKIMFSDFAIDVFTDLQIDDLENFYPKNANQAIYFYKIIDLDPILAKPSFIADVDWNGNIKDKPSAFLSGNKTIMPKMLIPTTQLTNNGLWDKDKNDSNYQAVDLTNYGDVFNWKTAEDYTKLYFYGHRSMIKEASAFINMQNATEILDSQIEDVLREFTLENPIDIKGPTDNFACSPTSPTGLVGAGVGGAAFALGYYFHTAPFTGMDADGNEVVKVPLLKAQFGDNALVISEDKELSMDINGQLTSGNLVEATQADKTAKPVTVHGQTVFCLVVYPAWNGIVMSNGIQDSEKTSSIASLYAIKNNQATMQKYLSPTMDEFDFDNPVPIEVTMPDTGETSVTTDFGTNLVLTWKNAIGAFSWTPVFYLKTAKFRVYFKDRYYDTTEDDPYQKVEFFAYPIFNKNHSMSEVFINNKSNKATMIEASKNEEEGSVYYYYDFEISQSVVTDIWERRGLEVFGYIQQTKETTKTKTRNSNGKFDIKVVVGEGAATTVTSWWDAIQSMSVRIGVDGATGSITIDKYAIMNQDTAPTQSIGGLKIYVEGGNDKLVKPGLIFSGVAMEIADTVGESADTLTVNLYGSERKMQDIKLINAPFWDGDQLKEPTEYLCNYGGIACGWKYGDSSAQLPRSSDFEAPAINFVAGTPVIEALRQIAEYAGHKFIIQADGIGYMYDLNDFGIPKIAISGGTSHTIEATVTISKNVQPELGNLYNAFLTTCLLANQGSEKSTMGDVLKLDVLPGIKYTPNQTTLPYLPWDNVMVSSIQGYLTNTDFQKIHEMKMKIGRVYMQSGSVTIPGNSTIQLCDNIIDASGKTWYVFDINHEIDLQSKTWTTSLSVAEPFNG